MENMLESTPPRALPNPDEAFEWAREAMRAKNWQQAAERWALLRQHYSDYGPVWAEAAVAYKELGEIEEAENLLEIGGGKIGSNQSILEQKAEIAIFKEEWSKAVEFLSLLKKIDPENIAGWVRIADVYDFQGREYVALEANKAAREKFQNRPWPYVQYAEMAMRRRNWSEALHRWEDVRKKFPYHASGYQRAAKAAKELGNESLAKQLKAAQVYGENWRLSLDSGLKYLKNPQKRSVKRFFELVFEKSRLNLKSEAKKNHLRYVWWILDPLLYMGVFYIVFGLLMSREGEGYVPYLLTGLVPFQWFAKTVQHSSGAIIGGKGLMNQVRISPLFFPFVTVFQNSGKQVLVFVMLFLILFLCGIPPTIKWVSLVPILLIEMLFILIVSCLVAMLSPFAKDILNLVPTGLQFLLFISGIFYSVDSIPAEWQSIFYLNPMATLLEQYRLVLVDGLWPNWQGLGWITLFLIGMSIGIFVLYKKCELLYPRVVIE